MDYEKLIGKVTNTLLVFLDEMRQEKIQFLRE